MSALNYSFKLSGNDHLHWNASMSYKTAVALNCVRNGFGNGSSHAVVGS